jgi:hypothetical protein
MNREGPLFWLVTTRHFSLLGRADGSLGEIWHQRDPTVGHAQNGWMAMPRQSPLGGLFFEGEFHGGRSGIQHIGYPGNLKLCNFNATVGGGALGIVDRVPTSRARSKLLQ